MTVLKPAAPAQRDTLLAALDAAERRAAALGDRIRALKNDIALGYTEHVEELGKLEPQWKAAAAEEAAALAALDRFDTAAEAAAREAQQRAAASAAQARPRAIAEARREFERRAAEVQAHADGLREAIGEYLEAGEKLARVAGTAEARRLFSASAVIARIWYGLFNRLRFVAPAGGIVNHVLAKTVLEGLIPASKINPAHPWCKQSLVDIEATSLDNCPLPFFVDRECAEAARRRLDRSGESLHIVPAPGGVWTLTQGRRQAPASAA